MAHSTISAGGSAPQPRDGLFALLAELDQPSVDSYLFVSEESGCAPRSPFSGLLRSLYFDPAAVLDLIDEIWPDRWMGRPGRGKEPLDRLPVVCFILRICDPEYGTVSNLKEARRRLEEDEGYGVRCGFDGRLPSYSVFATTAADVVTYWARFGECRVLSKQEERSVTCSVGPLDCSDGSNVDAGRLRLASELEVLGWKGNLPPLYLQDDKVSKACRVVGLPRGRAGVCNRDSLDGGAGVTLTNEDGAPLPSVERWPRDWAAYNVAQTHEGSDVKALLGGLADVINVTEARLRGPRGRGRRWFPLGQAVFAVVLKAYSGLACRPFESLLRECVEQGYLRDAPGGFSGWDVDATSVSVSSRVRIPQFNTVGSMVRAEWLTPLLLDLVTVTSRPLRDVEHVFAIDGTGWATRWYDRWLDHRLASEADRQQWVKLHLVVGTKTNVVARAAISPGHHHDNPYFRGLITETAKYFDIETVVADLGYSSHANHALGGELGFNVRIPFKSNTRSPSDDENSEWDKNLRFFLDHYEKFLAEYHQRSNGESTNGALKVTQPQKLRTKSFDAQMNEGLAKLLAYNLRVLAREVRMRGIELDLLAEVCLFEDCIRNVVDMRSCRASSRAV